MCYGILQKENNWFQSYLCNRKQQVHVYGVASELHIISTGVRQRSRINIRTSIISYTVINDLPQSSI